MKRKLICTKKDTKGNRLLKVWENKNSLYAAVYHYDSKVKYMSASFNFSDGDATIENVRNYFNF